VSLRQPAASGGGGGGGVAGWSKTVQLNGVLSVEAPIYVDDCPARCVVASMVHVPGEDEMGGGSGALYAESGGLGAKISSTVQSTMPFVGAGSGQLGVGMTVIEAGASLYFFMSSAAFRGSLTLHFLPVE
jgi:hypothetical protein